MTDVYDVYGVDYDGTLISGITQQTLDTQSDLRAVSASGLVNPALASLIAQMPIGSFTTLHLDEALTAIGINGVALTSDAALTMYGHKHAAGGGREGATSHKKYLINCGIVVPRSLTCDHQGDATLQYDVVIAYDGTNVPIVPSESQSLAANPTNAERFTLGPISVGGVALSDYRSLSIDFGIDVMQEGSESDIWPTHVSIREKKPSITIRGIDPDWFKVAAAVDMDGIAGTHANTTLYLRKRLAGGTFATGSNHIKLTAAGIIVPTPAFDGTHGSAGETGLQIQTYHDGTNEPIVVTTDQALP